MLVLLVVTTLRTRVIPGSFQGWVRTGHVASENFPYPTQGGADAFFLGHDYPDDATLSHCGGLSLRAVYP